MKKVTLVGSLIFVITFIIGVVVALQHGGKEDIYVHTQLTLSDDLTRRASSHRVLYLVIYDEGSKMPMPYGAARFILQSSPSGNFINISLNHENLKVMGGPNQPKPKTMRIKARLDVDGQAGKDQPGDIVGEATQIAYGSTNVAIKLNKVF